jgi:hypothetical protein
MGQCIYLTDLDDTLFRSFHKHPQGEALTRVTTATNGHHGHMNPVQQGLFSALRATGVVPFPGSISILVPGAPFWPMGR